MPRRAALKVVTRAGTPTLYVRGTVRGQGVFESTGTSDGRLAEEYRAALEQRLYREAVHGPAPAAAAVHTWPEAVVGYLETETRSANTKSFLKKLLVLWVNKPLPEVNQVAVDQACKAILRPDVAGATKLRQVVTPVRAVLKHAAARGMLPMMPTIATPKIDKSRRTAFLLPFQVVTLIRAASPLLRPMLAFAVATGARPSEYLDLEWSDVDLRGARARLKLKGGGTRECDLPPVALAALKSIDHREGHVFLTAKGTRYRDTGRSSGGQFSVGWAGACQRAGLPGTLRTYTRADRKMGPSYERFAPDYVPYVLRHSWASWHYCMHKNLVLLEQDGAWSSTDMLAVYVHLVPEVYADDIRAFIAGKVDLNLTGPAVDRRIRAVAVQSQDTEHPKRYKTA